MSRPTWFMTHLRGDVSHRKKPAFYDIVDYILGQFNVDLLAWRRD